MQPDLLGVGWNFPIRVGPKGGLELVRQEQAVEQAVWLILATAKGQRVMRPGFGCGIHEYVFAPNNPHTRGALAIDVREALVNWEPRIEVLDVSVTAPEEQPNLLLIRVDYRIRATNTFANLVYPFYLKPGTEEA